MNGYQEEGDPGGGDLVLPKSSSAWSRSWKTETVGIIAIDPGTYLILGEVEGECKVSKEFIAYIFHAETPEILKEILNTLKKLCDTNNTRIINGVYCPNGDVHIMTRYPKIKFNGPFVKLDVTLVDYDIPSPQAEVSTSTKECKIFTEAQIRKANDTLLEKSHPELSTASLIPSYNFHIFATADNPAYEVSFNIHANKMSTTWSESTREVRITYSTEFGTSSQEQQANHNTNKFWKYRDYLKARLKEGVRNIISYLANHSVLSQEEVQNLLQQNPHDPAQVAELLEILIHREPPLECFLEALMKSDYKSNHDIANTLRNDGSLYRETSV